MTYLHRAFVPAPMYSIAYLHTNMCTVDMSLGLRYCYCFNNCYSIVEYRTELTKILIYEYHERLT